jgi:hypothetical protein
MPVYGICIMPTHPVYECRKRRCLNVIYIYIYVCILIRRKRAIRKRLQLLQRLHTQHPRPRAPRQQGPFPLGTQFTCFTSTQFTCFTSARRQRGPFPPGTQFTWFTSTNVQIMTPEDLRASSSTSSLPSSSASTNVQILLD